MPVSTLTSIAKLRADFPILETEIHGKKLVYLDNGASSQKPLSVIEAQSAYWETENANVHRGVHYLSQIATQKYEQARYAAQRLVNAGSPHDVIFTKGCTESINLVAEGLSSNGGSTSTTGHRPAWIQKDDVLLVSLMEHHSNIVPWQMAAARVGAIVKQIPVTDRGELDLDAYRELLRTHPVKMVAITHISNAMGTINPIKEIVADAHRAGALVMVDGAQAGPHLRIDVQDLDADFYAVSCHKMFAPTGIGVLFGKRRLLEEMPAYQGGGDMIHTVDIELGTAYAPLPAKFEAGTPNIAGAIGLGSAIQYLEAIGEGFDDPLAGALGLFAAREKTLAEAAEAALVEIDGLSIHGTAPHKAGIVSFTLTAAHPHDVGTILDHDGVAVRTGHHCCMPLMKRFNLSATTRASFSFYNDEDDVARLVAGVRHVQEMFAS